MRLSDENKKDIIKLYNENVTFSEIKKKYDISRATYYRVIKENKEKSIIQSSDNDNDTNDDNDNDDKSDNENDDNSVNDNENDDNETNNDDKSVNDTNNDNNFDKEEFKKQLNTSSEDEKEIEQIIENKPLFKKKIKNENENENETNNNISFISKTSRVSFGRPKKIYQLLIKALY